MTRPKIKQVPNKTCTPSDPDIEECVRDGWVFVKKQKVTILIPPLPNTEQPIAAKKVDHIKGPQPGVNHITALHLDPSLTIEKTMPLPTTKPITAYSNPPKVNHRTTSANWHSNEPSRLKTLAICGAPKTSRHCGNSLNGHMLANPKMRALNLERKLKRAGGLDSWLVSLGLGQFVKIFRSKRVNKMQLANLTMQKLKDMGADAVGPRRKLMHAIDCLW
ncbi:Sterile alpha motif domain-containing protein [Artemisia annua]|uniref:Sterile alpha motif domain-containing protein n=1 Tax=Artemisia annua TaxID=35608 RepID=A0A2U1PM43_ARTAN|nr:Sterile alpha motif domain-containing protein [Artemisia annua]